MTSRFADNPAYNRYEALIVVLDDLDALGMNDSDEAEVVREEMDGLYKKLSGPEVDRLRIVSADLYMFRDLEVPERLAPGETPEMVEEATREAWRTQDMERLLASLRKAPAFLSREAVASLRSYAYGKLGHYYIAFLFKKLAAELNPAQVGHRIELMDFYRRMGRWEDAFTEARFLMNNETATDDMKRIAFLTLSLLPVPAEERRSQNNFAVASRLQDAATERESRELLAA